MAASDERRLRVAASMAAGLRAVSEAVRNALPYTYLREIPHCRTNTQDTLRYVFQGSDTSLYQPCDTLMVDIDERLLRSFITLGPCAALVPDLQLVKQMHVAPLTGTSTMSFTVYINSHDKLDPRERRKRALAPLPASKSEAEKHVEQQTTLLRKVRFIGGGDAGGTTK